MSPYVYMIDLLTCFFHAWLLQTGRRYGTVATRCLSPSESTPRGRIHPSPGRYSPSYLLDYAYCGPLPPTEVFSPGDVIVTSFHPWEEEPRRLYILCWSELSRRKLLPAVSPAAGHLTTPTAAGLPGLCENFRPTTSKSSPI